MHRTIYLLRHGQTAFNTERRMQGHCDSPLTELGLAQARAMGLTLKRELDNPQSWAILSSPLPRARHTARLVAAELGLPADQITIDARLIEVSFGEWEQRCVPEVFAQHPALEQLPDWYFHAPGCEPYAQIVARIEHWLSDPQLPERMIVVAHGLLGRIFRGVYARMAQAELWQQDMPQDAFFRLQGGRIERISCL
ncbi:histidine phosphatase family protein [Chitinilyticum piscinae]|uniref:Histidine phosphatase family protein n=1 Tax=Chitinilyticum piscinae TaxID=2866724 RepID=A0A8J7KEM0_9NEIS|nr:histidine phosphatase family protein [Chitinilyticum piscinae]MBE9609654.1 histidine phosphatase family protein [Chitinilyticum piscinae]